METTCAISFNEIKSKVQSNFKALASTTLFYVAIDRDRIWELYLNGFEEEDKQEHNCNCCKSFLRQYAGIVQIKNNKVISLWDNLKDLGQYEAPINAIREYIHSLPITDVFLTDSSRAGTDKNRDKVRNVVWNHFYLDIPSTYIKSKYDLDTLRGSLRSNKEVLMNSIQKISKSAVEEVQDLIKEGSLYRGNEFLSIVKQMGQLLNETDSLTPEQLELYCWTKSVQNPSLCRIKNTVIGTLLVAITEGEDLETAVRKYEAMVAPTNYKRPTALVTPAMVAKAKEKLIELGLMMSLERRFATEADLKTSDILFVDKSSVLIDVFEDMTKDALVNPRSLAKSPELSINQFITDILPKCSSVEVLLENSHKGKLVSLITSVDKDAKPLFKWPNNFSWSYTGGITDSIKERVKAAGGKVDGILRTSLSWSNYDDLDIHVIEPNTNRIYYGNRHSRYSGGELDVDMNAGGGSTRTPVENIVWQDESKMLKGKYKVIVNNFSKRETTGQGFTVQLEYKGEQFEFSSDKNPASKADITAFEFEITQSGDIKFTKEMNSSIASEPIWGIGTNKFHKVKQFMLSPNHWGTDTGNKHYFFFLENCLSDETPRPFFNEFLRPEFDEHGKVFEIMGSKLKIQPSDTQVSGIGFSETQRNSMIVRVKGYTHSNNIFKINF